MLTRIALVCCLALAAQPALARDPFAKARFDITAYCAGQTKTPTARQSCIAKQKSEMGYFVNMLAGFRDQSAAQRCMMAGKKGRYVDWTIATPCMRKAVKGRPLKGLGK